MCVPPDPPVHHHVIDHPVPILDDLILAHALSKKVVHGALVYNNTQV